MSDTKFKIWDSIAINDALKTVIQLKDKIETISHENKTEVEYMPPSIIPTVELYNIVACYEAMYRVLLDKSLVMTGNLKSSKNRNNIH